MYGELKSPRVVNITEGEEAVVDKSTWRFEVVNRLLVGGGGLREREKGRGEVFTKDGQIYSCLPAGLIRKQGGWLRSVRLGATHQRNQTKSGFPRRDRLPIQ